MGCLRLFKKTVHVTNSQIEFFSVRLEVAFGVKITAKCDTILNSEVDTLSIEYGEVYG